MVAADPARLESLRPVARDFAIQHNQRVQLVRFSVREELEAFLTPEYAELLELVQALRAGNGEAAEAAMRKHLSATRESRHTLFRFDLEDSGKEDIRPLIAS